MPDTLLKRWNDWSAGVGHLVDDGRILGMYQASGLLGLRGELRPAPFKNAVTVGADLAHHYQYFFEEALDNQTPVHDADSSGNTNTSTTLTVEHVIANKPNRALYVWTMGDASPTTSRSIKYNGKALTALAGKSDAGDNVQIALHVLVNPDVGTHDIVLTIDPGSRLVLLATSFYRVSQSVATFLTAPVY